MTDGRSDEQLPDPRLAIGGNNPPEDFHLQANIDGLPARLEAEYGSRMALIIDAIAERANKAPTVFATDEDFASAGDIIGAARDAFDEFDGKRKVAKEPYKTGVDLVDGYFREPLKRLSRIADAFTERGTLYVKDKARKAEAAAKAERERLARIAEENRKAAQAAAEFDDNHEEAATRTQIAETIEARIEDIAAPKPEPVRGSEGSSASGKKEWTFEILDAAKVDLNALRNFIAPDAIDKALKAHVKIQKQNAKVDGVRFFEEDKASFRRR